MVFVRLLTILLFLSGCQLNYLFHVSYNHLALLSSTESIDEVLASDRFTEEQKRKIKRTQAVRIYAFEKLNLKKTKNYSEFADIKRPYVTYAVTASQKWKFEPYLWTFPFTGDVSYKGFFNEELSKQEATELKNKNLDVYVRGVSAYSTLGMFLADPLLSSMLNYSEHNLVNTIFHELVHTTIFVKDNVNFNERLAVFIANKATEQYYLEIEGKNSKTLKTILNENADDTLFSNFITNEINQLKSWYDNFDHSENLPADDKEALRQDRLKQIAVNFEKKIKPNLKTESYGYIFKKNYNNADLIVYDTYMKDLDVFEKAYMKTGGTIPAFIKKCEELKNSENPEAQLAQWAGGN